jgi:RNA polymerase sigma-70 factor (ECF subfamily)
VVTGDFPIASLLVYTPELMGVSGEALGEQEFRRIYREELGYVFNSLRRLGVAAKDAEDLVHDTFVAAWRRRDSFDSTRPVRPWLFGIAFRVASDFRRLARNQREVADEGHDAADPGQSPEEDVERAEARAKVLRALESVEIERRAVFILHEIDGQSIPEVAAALEINVNTAYSRLRLARADFEGAIRRMAAADATIVARGDAR